MSLHHACLAAFVILFLFFSIASPDATAQAQAKVTGLIVLRSGEVMNVKTADGRTVEVVLNPDTRIEEPQGVFGFRKKDLNVTALVPGMNVTVQGQQYENNQFIAKTVTFSRQSLESPQGTQATSGGQSAMAKPSSLSNYEVKTTYDAHFEAGSALLSETDRAGLMQLATNAAALGKYMVEVQGFADFPGDNAYDQQLSHDRAEAVIDFLKTSGRIPVTRIVAPGGPESFASVDRE